MPTRTEVQTPGPHVALARDRRRYERLLLARMGGLLSNEDAEDIVSESLIRVQVKSADDPPKRGHEEAWFARVVLNLGIDFLRARDGRRRNGAVPRPATVPLTEIDHESPTLAADDGDESLEFSRLAEEAERTQAQALVQRVMAALDPKDAELLKLRHLFAARASRDEVAAMAGLTVGEFKYRSARAWQNFVRAVASDAPTERCGRARELLGKMEAGGAPPSAAAEVDAHILDCVSCRVFARESYRALELMPLVPVVGFAERWSTRIGCWWDRAGPEASAGAGTAAAGAGLWGLLGGTGAAGLLKAIAIVCTATAVTASVCAGVVAVINAPPHPDRSPTNHATRSAAPASAATAAPRPSAQPTAVATSVRRSAGHRERRNESRTRPAIDLSGRSQIPASAPDGASEFSPSASSASIDPAPATAAGGGEFTP